MFEFWFSCSALEIPKTTQLLNDILFPVVLFVLIFWLMCEILVDGELPSREYPRWQIRNNSTSIGENLNDDVVTIRKVTSDREQRDFVNFNPNTAIANKKVQYFLIK
ncbi:MAG: hypothetical protein HC836_41100 [Richelia sp. RM2_1_2]|nr:hypothetical protein [Richelia sp. RM2_1_2]